MNQFLQIETKMKYSQNKRYLKFVELIKQKEDDRKQFEQADMCLIRRPKLISKRIWQRRQPGYKGKLGLYTIDFTCVSCRSEGDQENETLNSLLEQLIHKILEKECLIKIYRNQLNQIIAIWRRD